MAPHELDQPDPVHGATRFYIGRSNGFYGFGKSGLEPETFVDIHDVVIDSLRDPDDALGQTPPAKFGIDGGSSPQRAVAADNEKSINVQLLQMIDHLSHILWPARAAQNRTAERGDGRNGVRPERQRDMPKAGH